MAELRAIGESTHLQIANEATHLLRASRRARYQHVIVDEGQDLHPAQWRLLRAAVARPIGLFGPPPKRRAGEPPP